MDTSGQNRSGNEIPDNQVIGINMSTKTIAYISLSNMPLYMKMERLRSNLLDIYNPEDFEKTKEQIDETEWEARRISSIETCLQETVQAITDDVNSGTEDRQRIPYGIPSGDLGGSIIHTYRPANIGAKIHLR